MAGVVAVVRLRRLYFHLFLPPPPKWKVFERKTTGIRTFKPDFVDVAATTRSDFEFGSDPSSHVGVHARTHVSQAFTCYRQAFTPLHDTLPSRLRLYGNLASLEIRRKIRRILCQDVNKEDHWSSRNLM